VGVGDGEGLGDVLVGVGVEVLVGVGVEVGEGLDDVFAGVGVVDGDGVRERQCLDLTEWHR